MIQPTTEDDVRSAGPSHSVNPERELARIEKALKMADTANKKARRRTKSYAPLIHAYKKNTEPEFSSLVERRSNSDNEIPIPRPRIHAPHLLKTEHIHSYEYFQFRIKELNQKTTSIGSTNEKIIVFFTANDKPGRRSGTWCKDCNYVESLIAKFKIPKEDGSYLIRVKVGTLEEWKSPTNPYRTDPRIRLTSIPTIVVWNRDYYRLEGEAILDVKQLMAVFDSSIDTSWYRRRNKLPSPSRLQTPRFS